MRGLVSRCLVVVGVLGALAAPPVATGEEPFSFYGLQFGASRQELGRRFALAGDLVGEPGHGMSSLELGFDREGLLLEIRASWPRPEDALEYQGFLRALREKFVAPVNQRFPEVAVTLDEYSNRAAVRLVMLSTTLRERNIDHHKNRFLETLK